MTSLRDSEGDLSPHIRMQNLTIEALGSRISERMHKQGKQTQAKTVPKKILPIIRSTAFRS